MLDADDHETHIAAYTEFRSALRPSLRGRLFAVRQRRRHRKMAAHAAAHKALANRFDTPHPPLAPPQPRL